jgi:hypothetical protein
MAVLTFGYDAGVIRKRSPRAGLRVDGWFGFSLPHLGLIGSRTTNGGNLLDPNQP